MASAWAVLLLQGSVAIAQGGAGQRARVELVYETPSEGDCPSEQTFRDIVAGRLGYDPFESGGDRVVRARIEQVATTGFTGQVSIESADGEVVGERGFDAAEPACVEVARSMAIAITLTLDPLGMGQSQGTDARHDTEGEDTESPANGAPNDATDAQGPQATERSGEPDDAHRMEEATTAEMADGPTPLTPPLRELPERTRLVYHGQLAVIGALGAAPRGVAGFQGGVGIGVSRWRFLLLGETGWMVGDATLAAGDRVSVRSWQLGLAGCGRYGLLLGCVGLGAGQLVARGHDLVNTRAQRVFYGTARGSVGIEVPLGSTLAFQGLVEAAVPMGQVSILIEEEAIWTTPWIQGRLLLGLTARWAP